MAMFRCMASTFDSEQHILQRVKEPEIYYLLEEISRNEIFVDCTGLFFINYYHQKVSSIKYSRHNACSWMLKEDKWASMWNRHGIHRQDMSKYVE